MSYLRQSPSLKEAFQGMSQFESLEDYISFKIETQNHRNNGDKEITRSNQQSRGSTNKSREKVQFSKEQKTDRLVETDQLICGWLRKTVQQVKMLQQSPFPLRYYTFDKKSKTLLMHTQPGSKCKETIHVSQIKAVEVFDMSNDQKRGKVAAVDVPLEFPYPFVLYLNDRIVMLWAKTEEQQSAWASTITKDVNEHLNASGPTAQLWREKLITKHFVSPETFPCQLTKKIRNRFEPQKLAQDSHQNALLDKLISDTREQGKNDEKRSHSCALPSPSNKPNSRSNSIGEWKPIQVQTIGSMKISREIVQGIVKKQVKNTKLGLFENVFHKRKMIMSFRQKPPTLVLQTMEGEAFKQRPIPLDQITYVSQIQQNKAEETGKISRKERPRSSSFRRALTKVKDQVAGKDDKPFNYGFEIHVPGRQFCLYTEHDIEVGRWLKVLNTIVLMNAAKVSLSDIHPFDYEQQTQVPVHEQNHTMPVVKQGRLPQFGDRVKKGKEENQAENNQNFAQNQTENKHFDEKVDEINLDKGEKGPKTAALQQDQSCIESQPVQKSQSSSQKNETQSPEQETRPENQADEQCNGQKKQFRRKAYKQLNTENQQTESKLDCTPEPQKVQHSLKERSQDSNQKSVIVKSTKPNASAIEFLENTDQPAQVKRIKLKRKKSPQNSTTTLTQNINMLSMRNKEQADAVGKQSDCSTSRTPIQVLTPHKSLSSSRNRNMPVVLRSVSNMQVARNQGTDVYALAQNMSFDQIQCKPQPIARDRNQSQLVSSYPLTSNIDFEELVQKQRDRQFFDKLFDMHDQRAKIKDPASKIPQLSQQRFVSKIKVAAQEDHDLKVGLPVQKYNANCMAEPYNDDEPTKPQIISEPQQESGNGLGVVAPIELSDWDADSAEGANNVRGVAREETKQVYNDEEFESVW